MTLLIWLAITAKGLTIFPSAQDACIAADVNGLASVYSVQKRDSTNCCEDWDSFRAACNKKPQDWSCNTPVELKKMRCVKSAAFTTVEDK